MTTTPTRLSAPRVRVVVDDPAKGMVEVVLQTDNRDLVRWDVTRARKGWPEFKDSPFLWLTFLAWSVMQREGQTTLKLDAFLDTCTEASAVKKDGDDPEDIDALSGDDELTVGPTRTGLVSA